MIELTLTELPDKRIKIEMEGNKVEICKLLIRSMTGSLEFATIVIGAIPSFLDEKKIDRAEFCKEIMNAKGNRE